MPILHIVIGSGFNQHQEVGMGYLNELASDSLAIDVLSIDKISLPDTLPLKKNTRVYRLSLEIKDESDVRGCLSHMDLDSYERVIIIDSIHFIGYSDVYKLFIQHIKTYHPDIILNSIHYISLRYVNHSLGFLALDDNTNFRIDINKIFEDKKIELNQLYDSSQDKHRQRIQALFKAKKQSLFHSLSFVHSPGFNLLFQQPKQARSIFLDALEESITSQISCEILDFSQDDLNCRFC